MLGASFFEAFVATSFLVKGIIAQDSSPTGSTFPNIAPNCNAFHTVGGDDTGCYSVETKYGISHDDFIKWNPDVPDDCLTNFWAKSSYCVGVGAVESKSTSKSSSAASSSSKTTSSTSSTAASNSSRTSTSATATTISASSTTASSSSSTSTSATATTPYSIRNPISSWDISSTTVESAFPPKKTQAGQPSYCLNWHLVVAGETCKQIVGSATGTTLEQFLEWNPAVGSDCSGLYDGWWVCIAIQPQSVTISFDYTATEGLAEVPSATIFTPTVFPAADANFDPSPTQAGIVSNCKAFHQATDGETCRQLLQSGLFSQEQFFSWNPALEGNCNGLWLNYYYCVAAGDSLPAPATVTERPSSISQGQISTCTTWYDAGEDETCDEIVSMFGRFSKDSFIEWNPSIASSCSGLTEDQFLCVGVPGTPTTRTAAPPSTTAPPGDAPTQSGMAPNCKELWLVSSSDSCSSIGKSNGVSEKQLLAWNPALGTSTCTNLKPDVYICVAGDDISGEITSAIRTSSAASPTSSAVSAVTTPLPAQAGMVDGCRRFYFSQKGDGCWAIANSAGIALSDFYTWNPAVGTDCANLWPETWYCIGIAGAVTTISSGPPVPT